MVNFESFDADFFRPGADLVLNSPIVGMVATPSGKGYRLVASDGEVLTFGDAHFSGAATE